MMSVLLQAAIANSGKKRFAIIAETAFRTSSSCRAINIKQTKRTSSFTAHCPGVGSPQTGLLTGFPNRAIPSELVRAKHSDEVRCRPCSNDTAVTRAGNETAQANIIAFHWVGFLRRCFADVIVCPETAITHYGFGLLRAQVINYRVNRCILV